jgi:hypothetical protein
MEAIIAYCIANGLAFSCRRGGYTVENENSVGLLQPGAIRGAGDSLEAALKAYMSIALDQRAVVKEPLVSYVAEPTADVAVVDAFGKDERIPVKVVEPPIVEPPIGELPVVPPPLGEFPVKPSVETTGTV